MHYLGDDGLSDDTYQFADNLNYEVDAMQAQTDHVIDEAEHSAGFGEAAPDITTVLHGYGITPAEGLSDPTYQFADTLNNQVNAMQAQTGHVIDEAEHSPGFGEVDPHTAAVLRAYGLGDEILASSYQDYESQLWSGQADATVADGDLDIGDAQAALDTPDGQASA